MVAPGLFKVTNLKNLLVKYYSTIENIIYRIVIVKRCKHHAMLYTRYPIVARRAWPLGRVRRASKGILHTRRDEGCLQYK